MASKVNNPLMKQLIIASLLVLIVVIFAVQNAESVSVHFISWEVGMSLALLLIVTLIIGLFIGVLVITPRVLRSKKELNQLKKQLNDKINLKSPLSKNP